MKKISQAVLPVFLLLVTTLFKLQYPQVLGTSAPFLLYTAVVAITTLYSGWIMGVIIAFTSLLPIIYYFLSPDKSFSLSQAQFIQVSLFLLQDFIITGISYALQKANRKNSEAENKFKLLVEQACDLLVLRNREGKATYVSPNVIEAYGYTPEEYAALPFEKLVVPEYLDYFTNVLADIGTIPNEHRVVKAQFYRKDGSIRWMEGDVYNYFEQPGINALVSHIKDVTERVNLERQKDDFIGIASHELKTPIANIKGFVGLAQRSAKDSPDKVLKFLENANHNISRLQKLVGDLLDISKINSGQLNYTLEVFNYSQLLKDTVSSVQMHHLKHKFVLNSPDLAEVNGDRYRLEQVLINLIENAVKYSPDASKVIINAELFNSYIIVSIQDFGIGISEEHVSKIFNRFYRIDNTSMKYQGLGLGLFIASEVLKKHLGSFWLESTPGTGSTFSFLLPLASPKQIAPKTDNKTFYTADYISIQYQIETNVLEVDWRGYQTKQSVQDGCMLILDYVYKTGVSKVLNNNSLVKGNWSEAVDWGANVWFPLMDKAKIKFFAWIQSPAKFSRLSALKSVHMMQGEINVTFFEDKTAAEKWLAEQG